MKALLRWLMLRLNGWAMTHLCDDNHPPSEFLPLQWVHPAEVVIKAPPDMKMWNIQVTWIEVVDGIYSDVRTTDLQEFLKTREVS